MRATRLSIPLCIELISLLVFLSLQIGFIAYSEDKPLKPVPKEYADKHMPEGWWTDPKTIEAGRRVYEGRVKFKIKPEEKKKCAECHGVDGQPIKWDARDFTDPKRMNRFTDNYWFWRISEGVPTTNMPAWKDLLTEEQIWQAIAYEHTFSHDGNPAPHEH
ncbi:MAG: cytochrome c [Nitrospirae bacterium]|nr:cytochrome c [Nitrospirota bacterium]